MRFWDIQLLDAHLLIFFTTWRNRGCLLFHEREERGATYWMGMDYSMAKRMGCEDFSLGRSGAWDLLNRWILGWFSPIPNRAQESCSNSN